MDPSAPDTVAAIIGGVSTVLSQVGDAERAPWLFVRSWLAQSRFQLMDPAQRDASVLYDAVNDLFALPRDFPSRPRLAAMLVESHFHSQRLHESARVEAMVRLANVAQEEPNLHPEWPKRDAAVRALAISLAARDAKPGFSRHAALAELDRYAEIIGDEQPLAAIIDNARMAVNLANFGQSGDLGEVMRIAQRVEAGLHSHGTISPVELSLFSALVAAMDRIQRGDLAGGVAVVDEARKAAESLPPENRLRISFEQAVSTLNWLAPMIPSSSPVGDQNTDVLPLPQDTLKLLKEQAAQPGLSSLERATRLSVVASALMTVDTLPALDEAIGVARRALELSPRNDPRRPYHLLGAAMIHLRKAEITGDRTGGQVAAGTALLEEARELAGSSTHALWNMTTNPLAHAYRLSGRKDLARRTALTGLRGHAWTAVLQSTVADVHAAARHSADDALTTARWCLDDNDAEGAVRALELGRGLILYAAFENRDIDTRLVEAGSPQLATRWQQAQTNAPLHEVPAALRQEVASVLAGVPLNPDGTPTAAPAETATRLLEPPSTHEIRAALAALDIDALVYLVPGDDGSGAAVVVPADGAAEWLRLPRLNQQALGRFERFMVRQARSAVPERNSARDAQVAYDAGEDYGSSGGARSDSAVGQVCEWAWQAAIEPILDQFLHLPEGRPIRLVLVPIRELSRVPWHAARRSTARGGHQYALERAVFSYAASARMLCETAWRPQVPLSGPGLIVSDPDTAQRAAALPAARTEAQAVRDVFYPHARLLGRQPDGSRAPDGEASPAQVKQWLTDSSAGTVIHLACHAFVRASVGTDETSYLLLADGRRLGTEELISALTGTSERRLALAVLAACNSAESGRGYDEAFSLGTAFLANNTNCVISAQWSVPDMETSLLMFMFHHYLNSEKSSPVDALRQAQLWILGERVPPPTMPAQLRRHVRADEAPDPVTWAAFVHSGR